MGIIDDQFVFYASYHDNFINQICHIICVPIIALSMAIMLSFTPSVGTWTFPLMEKELPLNGSFLISLSYGTYYVIAEFPGYAGVIAAMLMFGAYLTSCSIIENYESRVAWDMGVWGFVLGFAAQIFTHQVYEKRSPALLDNVFQAFVVAPLFVVMEAMHMCFGYRAEFREKVQVQVDRNIKEFRAERARQSKGEKA